MKYLIAVDSSPDSKHAFEVAKGFFKEDDHVYIISVAEEVSPMITGPYGDMKVFLELNQQIEDFSKELLKGYGHELTELHIPHTCLLGKGIPKEVICHEAEELKVDVVFIGRRGMGKIKRAFTGSHSEYCVHNLHCSVFVIRAPPANNA